jgi:hypothetical protein
MGNPTRYRRDDGVVFITVHCRHRLVLPFVNSGIGKCRYCCIKKKWQKGGARPMTLCTACKGWFAEVISVYAPCTGIQHLCGDCLTQLLKRGELEEVAS